MNLLETAVLPRQELATRLLAELDKPAPILLGGPSKSGKTHTLYQLAGLLQNDGMAHQVVRHSDHDALAQIERVPATGVLLFDGLELATSEMLRALDQKASEGVRCVSTLSTDHEAQSYHDVLMQLATEAQPTSNSLIHTRSFRISPLAFDDARRIALIELETPLDSVMIAAITRLSWGRPGWLIDLLHLAESNKIRIDPHPRITGVNIGDMHLPMFHHPSQSAETILTPASIAAAIVLSELHERTLNGASDLVGMHAVSQLQEAGLLIESPHDTRMVGVPEIYAAALKLHADSTLVRQAQHVAAARLLAQESLGIALPEREAAYCAWTFKRGGSGGISREAQDLAVASAHGNLAGKVASELISFGYPEARDLLLHVNSSEAFGEFSRVQAAASLNGPVEGLRALRTLPTRVSHIPDEMADTSPRPLPNREYLVEFLRHVLQARTDALHSVSASTQMRSALDQSSPAEAFHDLDRTALLFARWNDIVPLDRDASELLSIALSHPQAEVSLLAEQLLILEGIRLGSKLAKPRTVTASNPEAGAGATYGTARFERISDLALDHRNELQDLQTASAVAEGVIALFSATSLFDTDALARTVQHFQGAAFHQLWTQHLVAASTALVAGNISKVAQEWTGFEARLPQFLPLRLQRVITAIGVELRDPTATPVKHRQPVHQLFDYFRGALDAVQVPTVSPTNEIVRLCGATPLPIFRMAEAHLDALEAQNPAALMRAAAGLQELKLWAPAAYALQGARTIFLRRRAIGSVSRCDEHLQALEISARVYAPWFSVSSISSSPRVRLTKREIAVAQLGSTGLSNREIAEQLSCSVRTVESHLSAARGKIGAADRSELSDRMKELGYL